MLTQASGVSDNFTGADGFESISDCESLKTVAAAARLEAGAAASLAMGAGSIAGLARRRRR